MIPFTTCMLFGSRGKWRVLQPPAPLECPQVSANITSNNQRLSSPPATPTREARPCPRPLLLGVQPRPPPARTPPSNPTFGDARSGGVGTCRACGVLGCRGAAACCGGGRAPPGGAEAAEGAGPAAQRAPPPAAAGAARRCGLCALVGRALRRAVCGAAAGSRRSSGDSYQVLRPAAGVDERAAGAGVPAPADRAEGNGVTIDISAGNVTYIPVGPPAEAPAALRRLSPDDWALLDAMGAGGAVGAAHIAGGRFLTMHKRRRKRLATRAPKDHAILDDVHHGQVQKILNDCGRWEFNAFALETVAGGRSLPVLCVHLFHWYGLLDYFNLDVVRVWKLFSLIEEGYHSTNPYHNSIHATDVTQAMHCFLQEEQIKQHLTPLEVMSSLIGAVAHDLDHPGVNQHFLITTSNHLAILYQNSSVLENHHWRSAVGCLIESGVADQLVSDVRRELERQIRDLILATDINRQPEFLSKFKQHLDRGTLDLRKPENRQFILQISLKCADISNPTRPWDISRRWSMKVCEEFFRQGEFERRLNLPVTSICDRQSTSVAKIQIGFFKHMVTPLFSEWHRFLHSRLSTRMMYLLESNWRRWEEQERAEQADETQTVLSDTGEADDGVMNVSEQMERRKSADTTPTASDFITPPLPPKDFAARRQSLAVPTFESLGIRRHSVPARSEATTPTGAAPALPRTIYRRESLPVSVRAGRSPVSPQAESRASSGLREEDELLSAFLTRYGSQSSDLSSGGSPHHSSAADDQPERPLSAENLLPEPTITSMTSSAAVGRLSALLQGGAGAASAPKCLTRQQTFPPPQPYVRVRYMSATAEMTTCPETPHEGDSRSNSSQGGSTSNISPLPGSSSATPPPHQPHIAGPPPPAAQPSYPIPAIAVLSPNNSRPPDVLLAGSDSSNGANGGARHKRDADGDKEKGEGKKVRLEGSAGSGGTAAGQKENMDPRRALAAVATSLSRRRGSAPVSLPLARPEEGGAPAGGGPPHGAAAPSELRRGSVPVEVAHYLTLGDESPPDRQQAQQHVLNITPVETTRTFWQYQRRGSAPLDLPPGPGLTRHVSLNGKAGRGRKKQLRRRSSGGPETVCLLQVHRCPPDHPDALLARRRGSLPVEVLTVGHSVF